MQWYVAETASLSISCPSPLFSGWCHTHHLLLTQVLKERKLRGDAQLQAKGIKKGPVASEKTTKQVRIPQLIVVTVTSYS